MPFSANELVNMCETLKQLVDGLIELTASTPRHSTMTLQTSSAHSNSTCFLFSIFLCKQLNSKYKCESGNVLF